MDRNQFSGSRVLTLGLIAMLTVAWLTACTPGSVTSATTAVSNETYFANQSSPDSDGTATIVQPQATAVDPEPVTADALAWAETVFAPEDLDSSWSQATATRIQLSGTSLSITGTGATAAGTIATITAPGTYVIRGTLSDGQILVNCATDGIVRLVLDQASIHGETSSPIWIQAASQVILVLPEGTVNSLSDGPIYDLADPESDEPNATLFSQADLTILGSGALQIDAHYKQAINSKDDLKIVGSTIDVQAVTDGMTGRDLLAVSDAALTIEAGEDGLRSTQDEDDTKGQVYIESGSIVVKAGQDGIQGEPLVLIAGGSIRVEAGDDAINGAQTVLVRGGDLTINAGDDAVHADALLIIDNGQLDIQSSYEGLESQTIHLNGGTVHLTARDDGINAAAGVDASGIAVRPGMTPDQLNGGSTSSTGNAGSGSLIIRGGTYWVDAAGDGIDVNGSVTQSGGTVQVSGPTDSRNGSIDYDGAFTVTGGVLITAGSAGMVQAPDSDSTINSLLLNFETSYPAGTLVNIRDDQDLSLVTLAPGKTFQSILFTSVAIETGKTYTISVGGQDTGTAEGILRTGGIYSGGSDLANLTVSTVLTAYGSTSLSGGAGRGPRPAVGGRTQPATAPDVQASASPST